MPPRGKTSKEPDEEKKIEPKDLMVAWQLQRYEEIGLDAAQAFDAWQAGLDWHDVDRLLRGGCDAETALKILS